MSTYSNEATRGGDPGYLAEPEAQRTARTAPVAEDFRRDVEGVRRDRIRWGPVWAGLVIAVSTYLLLQLALVGLGIVDLAQPTTADAVASAIAAFVSFFLGGLTAGATALWRGADDGLLHGVVMWAVGLVALVVLSAAGSGLALGSIDTTRAFDNLKAENVDRTQASDQAKDAAGKAALGVVGALVAAGAGGLAGAKLWPRRDDDTIDLRTPRRTV